MVQSATLLAIAEEEKQKDVTTMEFVGRNWWCIEPNANKRANLTLDALNKRFRKDSRTIIGESRTRGNSKIYNLIHLSIIFMRLLRQ